MTEELETTLDTLEQEVLDELENLRWSYFVGQFGSGVKVYSVV